MKSLLLKTNPYIAVLFITILVVLFYSFSYSFFTAKFEDIEDEQNKKNINSFLTTIDNELSKVESITVDYAYWDATYRFINDKNKQYTNENFREGSNTLEDLGLDFMLFTNLNNTPIYSTYINSTFLKETKNFEVELIKSFLNKKNISNLFKKEILKYQNRYFVITKNEISTSDNKAKPNGYLYSGKEITKKSLLKMNKSFKDIEILNKNNYLENYLDESSIYIKNIKINISKNDDTILNSVEYYNFDEKHLVTFVLKNSRDFMQKGKETIIFYNVIITTFLFVLLLAIYANIKLLQNYNNRLAKEIALKTQKLKDSNEKLKYLSQTDELTNISNRRMFFYEANKLFNLSEHTGANLSVLMIDIDNFKTINDTYGHSIGDEVLKHFSKKVTTLLEGKYVFGRLGGEEFAIVYYDLDEENAYELSQKIRKAIEDDYLEYENRKIKYTISSGFYLKEDENNLDYILNEADKLLYNAKKSGKNCIIRQRHLKKDKS